MTLATAKLITGDKVRTAIAGEYFVAAELTKRGWDAALTRKNTPSIDILAASPTTGDVVRIDVKTRKTRRPYAFDVGPKGIGIDACDFIICIALGDLDDAPRYWIIPAETARERTMIYPTRCVIRKPEFEEFYDAWDLLDS